MRGTHRLAVLAAATVVALTATAAGAAAPSWNEVTSPHVSGDASEIYAMTATGNNDVWAFGYDRADIAGTFEWRVLGEHWDGSQWTRLDTRDVETAPAQDFIWGASGTASDDVWIVGSSLTSVSVRIDHNLVEHWDGHQWSIDSSLPDVGDRSTLLGVSARTRTDVWAVGEATYSGGPDYSGIVLHRSGTVWAQVPFTLAVPGCNRIARGEFDAVDAVGADDVYVSGWCQSQPSGATRGFVSHWNGSSWTLVLQAPVRSELTQLTTAPDGQVWVGGTSSGSGPSAIDYPLVWHGTAATGWTQVPVRHSSRFNGPLGALTVSNAGVFIAGQLGNLHDTPFTTYALRLGADGKWRKEPVVPAGGTGYSRLHAAAAEPDGTLWLGGTHVGGASPDVQSMLARRD